MEYHTAMKMSYQSIGLHLKNNVRQGNKVVRKGALGVLLPFLPPSVSAPSTGFQQHYAGTEHLEVHNLCGP